MSVERVKKEEREREREIILLIYFEI